MLEGLCSLNGNDVTIYFRSAANRLDKTAVVADFTVAKRLFGKISETARANNFKIDQNLALDSVYISTGNDAIAYFRSTANRTNAIRCHLTFWINFARR